MYICPNCQKESEAPMNFCTTCGAPMVEKQEPAPAVIPAPVAAPAPVAEPAPAVQPVAAPAPQAPYTPPVQQAPYTPPVQQAPYTPPVQQAPYTPPVQQAPYTPPAQPTPYAPQYSYTNQQPTYPAPQGPAPALGKAIAGMSLSIGGFVFAILGLIEALAMSEMDGAALGMAVVFSLFSLPLCLVGLILSNGAANAGNTSKMCRVGKGLGIAGLIITGVSYFFGFAFLD